MATTDRRTIGTQVEDKTIQAKAVTRIATRFNGVHASVTVFNGRALLTGEAPDDATRRGIEREVAQIENIKGVLNEIVVDGVSSMANRSNDTLITGKVKAAMIDAKDVFTNAFKVTTDRGVVYLMGTVTAREAQRAAEIAADVPGVVKVVKVVDVISEDSLRRMTLSPAKESSSPRP